MKRLIIIDHSLCNWQGHHYECSISIAKAAIEQGYQAIIVSNKLFNSKFHPEAIAILPRFEVDWFDNPIVEQKEENLYQKFNKILSNLQDNSLEMTQEKVEKWIQYQTNYLKLTKPNTQTLLEKIAGSLTRLRQWIAKDIEHLTYLPFSNTLWGIFKIVWGVIRYLIQILFKRVVKLLNHYTSTPQTKTFKETLIDLWKELNLSGEDQILIHTIGIRQVEDLYHILCEHQEKDSPQFHVLLRRDPNEPLVTQAKGMGLTACFNHLATSKLWPHRIRFYTDTQELLARYNRLSSVKLTQVPVPFSTDKLLHLTEKKLGEPIHLVYLGDARYEKGYHHLPEVVKSLWEDYLSQDKIKFTLQSNFSIEGGEPGLLAIRLKLEQYPSSKVKLIKETMSPEDYYKLLRDADIVILPYDSLNYRHRTSGVLTEALAAGKPVIVPNNTWLAKQIDPTRGKVYNHPQEIGEKAQEIINNLAKFQGNAQEFRLNWLQQNTPGTFLKCILSQPDLTAISDSTETPDVTTQIPQSSQREIRTHILYIVKGEEMIEENKPQKKHFKILNYLFNCGYEISLITFSKYPTYQGGNYEYFYHQIRSITDGFLFKNSWILDHNSSTHIPLELDPHSYLQSLQESHASINQDWVNYNSINLPESLMQTLKQTGFDLIYMTESVMITLIKRLELDTLPILGQIDHFLSYQYALVNHQDISNIDWKKEVEFLNQYSYLITDNPIQFEKLKEILESPKIKYISESQQDYIGGMNEVLTEILGTKSLAFNPSKNVAILYPWGDILERKSGASKRVGLLTQYLKDRGYNLWVFTIGEQKDFYDHNIRYSYYQQQFSEVNLVTNIYRDAYQTWKNTDVLDSLNPNSFSEHQEHWLPWIYYQFRFDPQFKQELEKIVNWANIVILEYPFWAVTVGDICKRQGVKLIITAHDVLSQQLSLTSDLGKIALSEEIRGLKQADELICVSQEDQSFFSQYNLSASVIPNPVDLPNFQVNKNHPINNSILVRLKDNFCLFVGSQHHPNIEAVEQIRQVAKSDTSLQFVIVGGCCLPEEKGNFLSLGKISQESLVYLYQKATLILSPLLTGTGSSLKIIEAMAYGKVVLGTKISFRGYSVTSPIHCIIEDDLSRYPKLIHSLISNPQARKTIENQAQEFAQGYDYQIVYETYLKLIDNNH